MAGGGEDRNQEATVYVGNIDDRATEALIWELFLQAGPVVAVHMPKDRVTQLHQNFGFVEFASEEDSEYAIKILNMIKVFGKPLRVNKATSDKQSLEVGANIFIGNLDLLVDEKMLHDTFSAFGPLASAPRIQVNPETGVSKGYAFLSYTSFESADAAIEAMNGQFLANRPLNVSYSLKKDGKGERHGTAAERMLAAQANKFGQQPKLPNRMFADVSGQSHMGGRPPMHASHMAQPPPPGFAPYGHGRMPPHPPPGFGGPMMRPPMPPQQHMSGYGAPVPPHGQPMPPPPQYGYQPRR